MKRITPVNEYDFLSSSADVSQLTPMKDNPRRNLMQPSLMKLMEPSIMKLIEIDDVNNGMYIDLILYFNWYLI